MQNNKKRIMYQNIFKSIKLLFKFKKTYVFLIVFSNVLMTFLPYLSLILSQQLLNGIQSGESLKDNTIIYLILYLLVIVITFINSNFSNYISKRYVDYLFKELNIYFRKECTYLSYQDYENEKIYNLLQRAEQQIGNRPITVLNDLLRFVSSLISFLLSMVILTSWHTWIIFGFFVLPIVSYKYFFKINNYEYECITKRTEEERKSWYITHLLIKDYFIKEIKLLNITDYLLAKYNRILEEIYKQNIKINNKKFSFHIGYQLVNLIFSFLVIIMSFFETLQGNLMIGSFMTNINTTSKVESAISGIVSSFFELHKDSLYSSHLFDFLDIINERKKNEIINKIKIDEINQIDLKKVSYKYKNSNTLALKNINLTIKKGETIALVGENGSGKTTLIKILTGLYTDYTGDIFINKINLKNIDIHDLRNKMSVIFQDYNNYEFTVYENIALGDINNIKDYESVVTAARLAGIHDTISKLPNNYNQQLGNWFKEGIQISGGQWQKIAIARLLMRNADLYILDEPTAALDPSSEYNFFKNFLNKIDTNFRIFVTHRFINATISNKIIFMKDGEIIEIGNHDELMKLNKEYAKLYKIQVGEEI